MSRRRSCSAGTEAAPRTLADVDTQAPSGEQWTITHAQMSATIVEIGGGLREFTLDGVPVVDGYAQDERASGGRGQVLMPWPNRVRDGQYTFDGAAQQLPLSEPGRHNASHGLVRWAAWHLVRRSPDQLTVGHRLMPQPGWDWPLQFELTYALSDEGLTVTPAATNIGDAPAPFGYGAHPYLTLGRERVDGWTLTIPAATVLTVDEQLIPTGTASAAQAGVDFRTPRKIGDTALDIAYTDLTSEVDAATWQVSVASGERRVTLWADASAYRYVQVFTGDGLPAGQQRVSGVAVEPMTCPPNALATGEALIVLEPGERWSAPWGIRPWGSTPN